MKVIQTIYRILFSQKIRWNYFTIFSVVVGWCIPVQGTTREGGEAVDSPGMCRICPRVQSSGEICGDCPGEFMYGSHESKSPTNSVTEFF